jgi:hypothetical protein
MGDWGSGIRESRLRNVTFRRANARDVGCDPGADPAIVHVAS